MTARVERIRGFVNECESLVKRDRLFKIALPNLIWMTQLYGDDGCIDRQQIIEYDLTEIGKNRIGAMGGELGRIDKRSDYAYKEMYDWIKREHLRYGLFSLSYFSNFSLIQWTMLGGDETIRLILYFESADDAMLTKLKFG